MRQWFHSDKIWLKTLRNQSWRKDKRWTTSTSEEMDTHRSFVETVTTQSCQTVCVRRQCCQNLQCTSTDRSRQEMKDASRPCRTVSHHWTLHWKRRGIFLGSSWLHRSSHSSLVCPNSTLVIFAISSKNSIHCWIVSRQCQNEWRLKLFSVYCSRRMERWDPFLEEVLLVHNRGRAAYACGVNNSNIVCRSWISSRKFTSQQDYFAQTLQKQQNVQESARQKLHSYQLR